MVPLSQPPAFEAFPRRPQSSIRKPTRLLRQLGRNREVRVTLTACPPQDGLAVARGGAFYTEKNRVDEVFYAVYAVQSTDHLGK